MGGSPSMPAPQPLPPAPQPIDYDKMANASIRVAKAQSAEQEASIKAGRLGRPEEFGDAFAFLCSAQAGYISGQNLQLDGGSYEGIF